MKLVIDYLTKLKLSFIDDSHNFFKFWSTQLGLFGASFTAICIAYPTWAADIWLNLPDAAKSAIPQKYVILIGVTISLFGVISRGIKQKSLKGKEDDPT